MHPKSYFSQLQKLYTDIDFAIHKHYEENPESLYIQPCQEGCDACCSQFFEISEGESLLILDYIFSQPKEFQGQLIANIVVCHTTFVQKYPTFYLDYFKYADSQVFDADRYFDDTTRFHIRIPCPCLSEKGSCTIYPVRPLICRTTGSGYTTCDDGGEICEIIPSSLKAQQWQADLCRFQESIWSMSEISLTSNEESIIELRQFPLFYSLYEFINQSHSDDQARLNLTLNNYRNIERQELEEQLIKELILDDPQT